MSDVDKLWVFWVLSMLVAPSITYLWGFYDGKKRNSKTTLIHDT